MKAIKILAAAACTFCLSTTAFAQTTPAAGTTSGTMQSGTTSGTMQSGSTSGTMQNGTMTTPNQTGTDRMQSGTMQNGTMQNGTMQNGSMNGRMGDKTKMNSRKGTKKSKMSTTPSSTGTM